MINNKPHFRPAKGGTVKRLQLSHQLKSAHNRIPSSLMLPFAFNVFQHVYVLSDNY